MGGAKRSTWIGGTVFLALVIVAAAYLLAISPVLTRASESRAAAESTRLQNETLQLKVTQLAADFAKIDEYKSELASLRVQIPTTAELAEFLRQLDGVAVAHSVTLTAVSPGPPQEAVAAAPAPAADPTASTESATAEDGQSSDATAAVASVTPTGFVTIPISITAVGTYDNVLAMIGDLQSTTPRLFLVSGLTGTAQKQSDEGGGRPATATGDLEITISGFAFTLLDPSVVADVVDPAPGLPGAVAGKNPLIPVGGE